MFLKDGVPVAGLMANDGTAGAPDTWSVYLSTDDAGATVARATAAGGTVLVEPMQVDDLGTMAIAARPDRRRGRRLAAGHLRRHRRARRARARPGWFETLSTDYDARSRSTATSSAGRSPR